MLAALGRLQRTLACSAETASLHRLWTGVVGMRFMSREGLPEQEAPCWEINAILQCSASQQRVNKRTLKPLVSQCSIPALKIEACSKMDWCYLQSCTSSRSYNLKLHPCCVQGWTDAEGLLSARRRGAAAAAAAAGHQRQAEFLSYILTYLSRARPDRTSLCPPIHLPSPRPSLLMSRTRLAVWTSSCIHFKRTFSGRSAGLRSAHFSSTP